MSQFSWQPGIAAPVERWPYGVKGMLHILRPYWPAFSITVLLGLLHHGLAIATGGLGAYIVGSAIDGDELSSLAPLMFVLVALAVGRAIASFGETWVGHDLAYRMLAEVRYWVYWAVERVAPGGIADRRSGDLTSTVMDDCETLEVFYAHTLIEMFIAAFLTVGALAFLWYLHWSFAAVVAPVVLLTMVLPVMLRRIASAQGRRVREALGGVQSATVDTIQGLREIVMFGHEREQTGRLNSLGHELHHAQLRHGLRAGLQEATINSVAALGVLAVLILSSVHVLNDDLSPRMLPVAVVVSGLTLLAIVRFLVIVGNSGGMVAGASQRIFDLLNGVAPVTDPIAPVPLESQAAHIRFEGVSFRYQKSLPLALNSVDFEVRPGETVALVGPSGAGKSTCARLLLRFWDVESGAITINGHDLRSIAIEDLRDLIGYVSQDPYLFYDTAGENIRIAKPDAAQEELTTAAEAAQAHDFISATPDGYDTLIGERGIWLSGGERQRIAIARALLRKARILLVDEPTSMLDAFSERELRQAMDTARQGRTTLIIAHRLATIRSADRIVVLDRGHVLESGTHEELLDSGGMYAQMVAARRT